MFLTKLYVKLSGTRKAQVSNENKTAWRLREPYKKIERQSDLFSNIKGGRISNILYLPDSLSGKPAASRRIEEITFENVSFSKTTLEFIRFNKCKFIRCLFIGSEFNECDFWRCEFVACNFHKVRLRECRLDPHAVLKSLNKSSDTNIALNLFSELRRDAIELEDPDYAKRAGYQYYKWKRLHLNYKWRAGEIRFFGFFSDWILSVLGDYLVGYGWKLGRFVLASIILLVALTLWNYLTWPELAGNGSLDSPPTLIKSLYYTVITITTLGYGDITPVTALGMGSAVMQVMIGVIWMGMLVSVVARKVLP
jgi:hypothetical protein